MRTRSARAWLTAAAIAALLAGCDSNRNPTSPPIGAVVPDFTLQDVNPNSPTHEAYVSPRQFLGRISCWYFGHAG